MDFFEYVFQKVWTTPEQRLKASQGRVQLSKVQKSLEYFLSLVMAEGRGSGGLNYQIVSSREYIGFYGLNLFLPESIQYFKNPNQNRRLYLNLILQSVAIRKLEIYLPDKAHRHAIESRKSLLSNSWRVNQYLDKEYAFYNEFQRDLIADLSNEKSIDSSYSTWTELYLSRSEGESTSRLSVYLPRAKTNDRIPEYLFVTTPSLLVRPSKDFSESLMKPLNGERQEKKKISTEKKKANASIVESVDFEKEKANPVTHSFEKLETPDDYSGGRKMDSGDDELDSHSAGLDELRLDKVTRGGESVQSIFQAEGYFSAIGNDSSAGDRGVNSFLYPEWNASRNNYVKDHCRIYESHVDLSKNEGGFVAKAGLEQERLKLKYRRELSVWQRRIETLTNVPLIKRRNPEGDEIDIDEYIRDYPALLQRKNFSAKWYTQKKILHKEVAITILFDQSMSSDSWVRNLRVLDVILDSIGLAGILFKNLYPTVSVVGTWSNTRKHCAYEVYKDFNDDWVDFYGKSPDIAAQGYTRLGPALRHATQKLSERRERKRLLLIITDGKPTDVDGYEGIHGIADVKQSCLEAERLGIIPIALTIDSEAKQHFQRMFKHYRVLSNPQKFSEELFRVLLKVFYKKS